MVPPLVCIERDMDGISVEKDEKVIYELLPFEYNAAASFTYVSPAGPSFTSSTVPRSPG